MTVVVRTAFPHASRLPELFFAIFGHHPGWVKALLIARNRLAARFGLEVPDDADILHPVPRANYRVGEKIGPWPIFALWPDELVAGRDNKHLDFRVSILRERGPHGSHVTVSTICHPHGLAGKAYLLAIAPFHKLGVRQLLASAASRRRI
jgi:uncharacterized protein DUF2867